VLITATLHNFAVFIVIFAKQLYTDSSINQ